jgi:hypothetical protein
MNKKQVLDVAGKYITENHITFASRLCKKLKDGEFKDALNSTDLANLLNEGPGKKIKPKDLTASMQPLLEKGIVKVKNIKNVKMWMPGWIKTTTVSMTSEVVLPEKLIKSLGKTFKTEIDDLNLNYGKSGSCTAFLLRKILEKLLFLVFSKNNLQNKLRDKDGKFITLKLMLDLATKTNINGIPIILPKTAEKIDGIKFLGDTAAHNSLVNVEMKTISTQMPFIITAYQELAKNFN